MKDCKKHKEPCGCKITLPVECIRWYGENTTFLPIKTNENLESILLKIEQYIQDLNPSGEISLQNIGEGQQVYKGTTTAGNHQFRTLEAGENITITQNEETLIISSEYDIPFHNVLQGLQGGTTGQYYHLTQSQYNALGDIPNLQDVTDSGNVTNNSIMFTNQLDPFITNVIGYDTIDIRYNNSGDYSTYRRLTLNKEVPLHYQWGLLAQEHIYINRQGFRLGSDTPYNNALFGNINDSTGYTLGMSFWGTNFSGTPSRQRIIPDLSSGGDWVHTLQKKTGTIAHLSDMIVPNLQQVTDEGTITTNDVTFFYDSGNNYVEIKNAVGNQPQITVFGDNQFTDIYGGRIEFGSGAQGIGENGLFNNVTTNSRILVTTAGNTTAGLEYAQDYSSLYNNRTLVDKEYVDNNISNSSQDLQSVLEEGSQASITGKIIIESENVTLGLNSSYIKIYDGGNLQLYDNVEIIGNSDGIHINENSGNGYILPSQRGTNNQILQTDSIGNVIWDDIPVIPTQAVLYTPQTLTLTEQAQARENIGVTTSFYDQKWIWDEVTNPTKEFELDFTPTQIVWAYNTNTPIWMDDSDFEITGTTLTILTTAIEDGAIIRIGYYHE